MKRGDLVASEGQQLQSGEGTWKPRFEGREPVSLQAEYAEGGKSLDSVWERGDLVVLQPARGQGNEQNQSQRRKAGNPFKT